MYVTHKRISLCVCFGGHIIHIHKYICRKEREKDEVTINMAMVLLM